MTLHPHAAPVRRAVDAPPSPAQAAITTGLSSAEAAARLAEEGPNALPGGGRRKLLTIARETLREPMFLLLLLAGLIYLSIGDFQEGLTLFSFVLVTLAMTLIQEGRAERTLESLRDLSSPRALVIRDGRPQRIAGAAVVRGDLLKLGEGDRIPADALALEVDGLRVDESLLTGESVPVEKRAATPDESALQGRLDVLAWEVCRQVGEPSPRVFAGTLVVRGAAIVRVIATGPRSEMGRIGQSLASLAGEASPLERQVTQLVRRLAILAIAISLGLIAMHGLITGDWLQATLAGIALAMAMLPEEYPVVMTIFPALGARRLANSGVLTRRIQAIETLGATTVLCTDKTGTLTANRMSVTHLIAGGSALDQSITLDQGPVAGLPDAFHPLVEMAVLASVVDPFDPMEQALHRLGTQYLPDSSGRWRSWRLLKCYPLEPEVRAMGQVWMNPDSPLTAAGIVAAKGAPEAIAKLCGLTPAERARLLRNADQLAVAGLRVLAVAQSSGRGEPWPTTLGDLQFEFLGLLGLEDPIAPEVSAAVSECRSAGVRVLMVTGDYPATALAIGVAAGIAEAGADVLTGDEIASLDDAGLQRRITETRLCARISPSQKLRIVQALQASGEVVAMTGDGVNDAPALRAAHVGIAMGRRGTDVAREAASLVLVDDQFSAMVEALREGRRIFDNLRKAMRYALAVHVPIAGMALLPLFMGWPPLLLPMHIALLELIIDPACSVAFEGEPAEQQLMKRPPRDTRTPLLTQGMMILGLSQGLGVLVLVGFGFGWAIEHLNEEQARAFGFATLVAGNLSLILSNRAPERSLWQSLSRPNASLWWVIAGAAALLVATLQIPWIRDLLGFDALPWLQFGLAVGLGGLSLLWAELLRYAGLGRSLKKPKPALRSEPTGAAKPPEQ